MRETKQIMPTKGDAIPTSIGVLGIVSDFHECSTLHSSVIGTLVAGAYISWRMRDGKSSARMLYRFDTPEEFWRHLYRSLRGQQSLLIYSMDLYYTLTLLGVWDKILSRELLVTGAGPHVATGEKTGATWNGYCVMGDPPSILVVRPIGTSATIRFADVRNYGLADWGVLAECDRDNASGLGDESVLGRSHSEHATERAKATERFALALVSLVRDAKLGPLKLTSGSQSVAAWKRHWLNVPVYMHDCLEATKLERAAYYGGRCECRYIGRVYRERGIYPSGVIDRRTDRGIMLDGPVYHYDISSAFPSAACSETLPTRLAIYAADPPMGMVRELAVRYSVIAECVVTTDEAAYPVRREDDGIIVYPIGTYRTFLADAEFKHALSSGRVESVKQIAAYHYGVIGRDYMMHLWTLRRQYHDMGNATWEAITKRLMVAWVGKLGQVERTWIPVREYRSCYRFGQWHGHNPDTGEICQWRTFADESSYLAATGEGRESLPSVAACITSLVRLLLWATVRICGLDNVYYYDTDSIWTNRVGAGRLESSHYYRPGEMGGWRKVGEHSDVEFCGVKHYVADDTIKCAGLAKSTTVTRHGTTQSAEAVSMESWMWQRTLPLPVVIRRTLCASTDYRHGVVAADGSVHPHRLVYTHRGESNEYDDSMGGLRQKDGRLNADRGGPHG